MPKKEEIEELLSQGKISEGIRLKLREGMFQARYDVEELSERCGVTKEEALRWLDGEGKECDWEARAGILRLLLLGTPGKDMPCSNSPQLQTCIADLTRKYIYLDAVAPMQQRYVKEVGDMIQEMYCGYSTQFHP
ncbi:MAG: hypothetical protein IJJ26_08130 [Victivallales bacterium]|nr:hypothetical protein [Victivallales bacterium]